MNKLNQILISFQINRIYIFLLMLSYHSKSQVNEQLESQEHFQIFSNNTPQLYNVFLENVKDIEIETEVGNLPRLPRYIDGIYKEGIEGPKVRVIWPAPTDNKDVKKKGNYIIEGVVPGTTFTPKALVKIRSKKTKKSPNLQLSTFGLDEVSLDLDKLGSNSKFIQNRDKFILTLSKKNPDDFLYMFRNTFGQKQPEGAVPLSVWDSQEIKLRGHATGHYLSAISQAYSSTFYDKELQNIFLKKINYTVDVLYDLSKLSGRPNENNLNFVSNPLNIPTGQGKLEYDSDLSESGIRTDYWNWGEGFISAYPPDQFIMLERGAIYGVKSSQIWAPYYTLHKILAGLLDVYDATRNEKSLEISKGMAKWVYKRLNQLPKEKLISMWNLYIAGEYGGMNEVMGKLYRLTKDTDFLEAAKLFDNIQVFYGDEQHSHGLAKNVDTYRGLHANQHIPQIIGAIEMYKNIGNEDYFNISDNFWYKTTNDYSYSIGGVAGARKPANPECFVAEPSTLYENGFSQRGQNETCATYNMLKLTRQLFLFDPREELMAYYEKGLYNHILASVAQNNSANTYHIPLRAGSSKKFGNAEMNGFTCCNGTALESNTKLQNSIYFKSIDNNTLYINLFVSSSLNWKEKNVKISQSTSFPKEDRSIITIENDSEFDIKIRVPKWATNGYEIKINGKKHKSNIEVGRYIKLSKKWKKGDYIEVITPFQFHLEPVTDQQNIASLFYGPILLAAQEEKSLNEWRKINLNPQNLSESIIGNYKELEFMINGIKFLPFYESFGNYSVYMDISFK